MSRMRGREAERRALGSVAQRAVYAVLQYLVLERRDK